MATRKSQIQRKIDQISDPQKKKEAQTQSDLRQAPQRYNIGNTEVTKEEYKAYNASQGGSGGGQITPKVQQLIDRQAAIEQLRMGGVTLPAPRVGTSQPPLPVSVPVPASPGKAESTPTSYQQAQTDIAQTEAGVKDLFFDPLAPLTGKAQQVVSATSATQQPGLLTFNQEIQRIVDIARVSAQNLAKKAYKPLDRTLGFTAAKKGAIADHKQVATFTLSAMEQAAKAGDRASYEQLKSTFFASESAIKAMTSSAIDKDLTNARAELEYYEIARTFTIPNLDSQLTQAELALQMQQQLIQTAGQEIK